MATVKEMMMDAAASIETAAMMSAGDTFEGTLSSKFDEDWIRVEMTAGMLCTINLSGDDDGVTDTFLKLFDSRGGFIKQNDDIENVVGSGYDDVLTGHRQANTLQGLAVYDVPASTRTSQIPAIIACYRNLINVAIITRVANRLKETDAWSAFIVWAGVFSHGLRRRRASADEGFTQQTLKQSFHVRHTFP